MKAIDALALSKQKESEVIESQIREAAQHGFTFISRSEISTTMNKTLKQNGYVITQNGQGLMISWKK